MKRRTFLQITGASLSLYHFPGWAQESQQPRVVWILLRGAMDGLSALVPMADPDYATLRGRLSIEQPVKLDANWGVHPELTEFSRWFKQEQMIAWPAVASPYRERSHFDGQNVLENGSAEPYGLRDGWLNRALASATEKRGLAVGPTIPLSIQGSIEIQSWSPSVLPDPEEAIFERLEDLYATNSLLAERLATLLQTRDQVMEMDMEMGGRQTAQQSFMEMCGAAGKLLAAPAGPRIATLEIGGWDTHANQGADSGRLANQFRVLNSGLANLSAELGDAWDNTAVVVMTEFGRTAAVNGSNGTDHGTASAAFVFGGAVRRAEVAGDWPGLGTSDLYEGRDLRPTVDSRAILKGVLAQQLGISESQLAEKVFPGSALVDPIALS